MKNSTIALIAMAAALALQLFVVSPLSEKRAAMREELAAQYTSLIKHERFIRMVKDADGELRAAREELDAIEKLFAGERDVSLAMARLQGKIQDMASLSGLGILSMKPLTPVKYAGYNGLPIFMDCAGNALSLATFLKQIDQRTEMIAVEKLNVNVGRDGQLRIKIQLSGLMRS